MSSSYLTSTLPPELILLIGETLPPSSLNALTQTCSHLHSILQPTLDASLTPQLANEILLWAANLGKRDIVSKLLAPPFSTDSNTADSRGWTPLHGAARVGDVYMVQELLDAGADVARPCVKYHGMKPLYGAVVGQHVEATRLLLEHGADATDWGDDLWPLHPLEEAIDRANEEMVKLLLEWGADADVQGDSGMAALERAVQRDDLSIIRLLLEAGANPDINLHIDDIWPPPEEGEDGVMRLLVMHGATMEGPMATVMQNLKKLAKAEGITEDQLLVKAKAYFASIGARA